MFLCLYVFLYLFKSLLFKITPSRCMGRIYLTKEKSKEDTMNEIYQKNIEALKMVMIEYYIEQIEKAPSLKWAEKIKSKDGSSNLLLKHLPQRTTVYPLNGWKAKVEERVKERAFANGQATMVIGMALGYFIKEALEKAEEKHKFVVIEPDISILKLALETCDFSKFLLNRQLIITPTTDDVTFTLELLNEKFSIDHWEIITEGYTLRNGIYQTIAFNAVNILNQIRCNIGTVSTAGSQIADNDIANLPYVIHRRGINELENLYKDLPAVVVSTGPSLSKNLYRLIDNQHKVIIIAVGQALRPLLAYGIRPDFICSVDFGEVNLTHYEGLMDSDVPLVALNRSFAPLLKRWRGPMFVSSSPLTENTPELENRVHNILHSKGWTLQGGSVAHMCFGLATKLGCNPIIMIGQDLAYSDEQSHFPQADSRGTLSTNLNGEIMWEVKDPRCNLHGKSYSMGMPIVVEGYMFNEVITNVGLASFITSFERFIEIFPDATIINATEGGANIKGTKRMSLKRCLETYCKNAIEDKYKKVKPLLTECDNAMELVKKAAPLVQKEIALVNQIQSLCKKAIAENNKIKKFSSRLDNQYGKSKFTKALDANARFTLQAQKLIEKVSLIGLAIYGARRVIMHPKMTTKGGYEHLMKNKKDLKTSLERNRIIMQAAIDACRKLKQTYTETLACLERAIDHNSTDMLFFRQMEPKPNIDDAEEYFAAGNFARPMIEAAKIIYSYDDEILCNRAKEVLSKSKKMLEEEIEKARTLPDLSNKIDCIQLIYDAHKIGKDQKNFKEAIKMLEKAKELDPESELVDWGLATGYFHDGQLDKAIEKYEDRLIKITSNPRYLFEYGQVLIQQGQVKRGIRKIFEAIEKSDGKFDFFLWVLGDTLCGMKEFKAAIDQYKAYLDRFPADYEVWMKLKEAAKQINDQETYRKADNAIKQLKS
jgi:hypothetical protein